MSTYDDKLVSGNEMKSLVSQIYTDITNLNVGGTNLFLDGRMRKKQLVHYGYTNVSFAYVDGGGLNGGNAFALQRPVTGTDAYFICKISQYYECAGNYTLSFKLKSDDIVEETIRSICVQERTTFTGLSERFKMSNTTTDWKTVTLHFTITEEMILSSTPICVILRPDSNLTNTIYYTDFKLEKGDYATDWSPHPDDKADTVHTHTMSQISDLDNIDIGATNLCVGTSNCTGASVYKNDSDTGTLTLEIADSVYRNVKCVTLSLSQSTYKSGIKFTNICKQNPFKKGWYTFSGEYFTSDEVSRWQYLQAAVQTTALGYTVDNVTVPAIDNTDTGEQFTPVIGKWTKFKMSFLIDDGITEMIPTLYCRNDNTSTTLKLACVKIERGNFATDWSVSPEDAASSSSSGGSELDTDLSIYVLPSTGSDDTGDGSEASPYATFAKAVSVIPNNLNGHDVFILIEPTELDSAPLENFVNGKIFIRPYNVYNYDTSKVVTFTSQFSITNCSYVDFTYGKFVINLKTFMAINTSNIRFSTYMQFQQADASRNTAGLNIYDSKISSGSAGNPVIEISTYGTALALMNSIFECGTLALSSASSKRCFDVKPSSVLKYRSLTLLNSTSFINNGEIIDLTTKIHQSANNTDYTTYRSRNIGFGTTSTPTADSTYGGNGAIYFYYT